MAKRYGGEFSPQGESSRESVTAPPARPLEASFKGRAPARHGAKINLLFIAPLGVFLTAFFQPTVAMVTDLAGGAVLLLAAWLLRDGIRAEDAYNERKVARRPAIPRKIFASILTGVGVGLLVFGGQWNLATALIAGAISSALHLFIFQPDPMKDKGLDGVDQFQTNRVARKIEEAETVLEAMKDAIHRARDRQLEARVDGFQATVREMFRTVEDDPRDLTGARKYLGVYLQGARDATVKFADIYGRGRDPQVRADYVTLLDDLETNFSARTQRMLLDDRSDLDVEIEVLRDRLNRDNLIHERGQTHE
ncbi:5-bromo-4-chloroindolyl phosphate hydrolysis family protein [Fontisubflavum oceani]|uniref:5-bromo-4-chloroindolyl phosphate hydrolysis family protein n=1 Tax=Fontisubflavum oceani TaxID=2978973 RepID=UPI0025B2AB61|nr:5-bromo-4-chloroindolyl phosphate hydrolysis family protein [Fontisubflavum oceani]WJY21376.1 5-bromo-4-chloroindolyl phosphate hydrolysis family protein [Fontisubflavum oceani]